MNLALGLVLAAMVLVIFAMQGPLPEAAGITSGLAFILLGCTFLAGLVPQLPVGPVASVSLGGFLWPLVLAILLWQPQRLGWDMLAVWIGGLMYSILPMAGLLSTAAVYLICKGRPQCLSAALWAVVLGNTIRAVWLLVTGEAAILTLGTRFLPVVTALLLPCAMAAVWKAVKDFDTHYVHVKGDHS